MRKGCIVTHVHTYGPGAEKEENRQWAVEKKSAAAKTVVVHPFYCLLVSYLPWCKKKEPHDTCTMREIIHIQAGKQCY